MSVPATVRRPRLIWRRSVPIRRITASVAVGGVATFLILGCGNSATSAPAPPSTSPAATPAATTTTSSSPTCEGVERAESDVLATYRTKGKELAGDLDGDGKPERVTLRVDGSRPPRCQYLVVVEFATGSAVAAPVKPLEWPGTDPKLLFLAQIDGRPGVEPVIALSPANVYRPGAVFTLHDESLVRMRRQGVDPGELGELFPFYDEFPAGVDCAGERGTIVVTSGDLAENGRDDRHWDVTRSVYRAAGELFELVGEQEFRIEVGPEAQQRWPEIRGDPFPTCLERVG